MSRLSAHVEVGSIVRRVAGAGDFATIVRKGDPERGAILLLISSRGRHVASLERRLSLEDGAYLWQATGPADSASSAEIADFLAKRARFDADFWAVELDIADPERFIAETIASS